MLKSQVIDTCSKSQPVNNYSKLFAQRYLGHIVWHRMMYSVLINVYEYFLNNDGANGLLICCLYSATNYVVSRVTTIDQILDILWLELYI